MEIDDCKVGYIWTSVVRQLYTCTYIALYVMHVLIALACDLALIQHL